MPLTEEVVVSTFSKWSSRVVLLNEVVKNSVQLTFRFLGVFQGEIRFDSPPKASDTIFWFELTGFNG